MLNGPVFPLIPFFDNKLDIDIDAMKKYVDFLYSAGARNFLVDRYFDMLSNEEVVSVDTVISEYLSSKDNGYDFMLYTGDVPNSVCEGHKRSFLEGNFSSYIVLFGSIYPHVSILFDKFYREGYISRCYEALRLEDSIDRLTSICDCSAYIIIKTGLSIVYGTLRIERAPYKLLPYDKYSTVYSHIKNNRLGIYSQ